METSVEILGRARETLATARLGLDDILGEQAQRRLSGVRNLNVFGRAVTNVLQNLRSIESNFDSWYQPYVDEMRADPLLRYFYRWRSEILKEGILRTGSSIHVHSFNFPDDLLRHGPPPARATSFFIGDQSGGSGWLVELPNGITEKFYVDMPEDLVTSSVHFRDAPDLHLGIPVPDKSIETLSFLYFSYLESMLHSALAEFCGIDDDQLVS